ncbi:SspB-related isopeptide-forming adhesin [Streptococcus dysgalactiae]|uniref:SspB-related isopeptide-forming adhesin n=2 Tax=Streptococcus dysgalactiae TaxID=1334 RepID=UPI0024B72E1D|nr:SspB-related isopeptide-forming adhesin [Streptococcus dysgalactiae]
MKQMETKGYGYFRKTKAYGLVCGIALAGALTLGTTSVSADDVTPLNPATNLTTLQTPPTADQTQLAHQAGQQSGELVSEVSNTEWDNAVTTAQEAGVTVKQSEKVTHDSLSSAQADLEKQTQAVTEATTKQEANTTAINQAVSENKAIDQANRDEKARVDALNTKGEADTKAKNEAGQAQVDAQNKQAQEAADTMNARLKADYEAKLTEIKQIESENEAIRQRNQQASQATHQANQAAQAAYQEKLAEIERIKAGNAAIRDRNAKAQQEAERQNQALQAAYEAKLVEIKQIESENEAIRQRNEQAGQATNQTNQVAQAEYQQKLAEIERIKAENAAIRDRNAKARQEAERQNQQTLADYEKQHGEAAQALKDYLAKAPDNVTLDPIFSAEPATAPNGDVIKDEFTYNSADNTFVWTKQLHDWKKFVGKVNIHGKLGVTKTVDPTTGNVKSVITSVTLTHLEHTNFAEPEAVVFEDNVWIYDNANQEIFHTKFDVRQAGKIDIHKTYTVNKTFDLAAGQKGESFLLANIKDVWVTGEPSNLSVTFNNTNRPKPELPGEPPQLVTPVLEQEKPLPPTPEKPTDGVPNVEKEKPVPPTPVKPETVKPDLKSFTPEVYDPIKPVVKPHVTVPEKVVYEVMVHPVQVKQTPTNVKSVTNSDQVNIDGQLVPKGSTVTWELVNTSLKAGRQDITSYELTDPLPDGFELDVTATQTLSPDWVITTDEAGKVSLKASQTLLDDLNAKRDQDVEVPKVSLVGRLLNDAGTYHNTFKTVVTTPTGSYTVISNTPVIYTPGNDPKTPRNPGGDNPTPHDNLIQPTKTIVDDKGQSIDGKSVLPNSTLTYVAKQDFDQYKGMTAAKESVMKGFIYVDDYKDEAIDGHSLVVNAIKAANGDDVTNLLEMRHVLSQDTLDDKLKALIKASGISPVGEFYMWVAKDPAAFYKAYVQKGLDITYNLSFKLKQEFKKGDITNQTYQLDMGNGYYGNVVVNHLPELTVHKEVLDQDGKSIQNGTVKIGDEVTYKLEGWVVPSNRGYDLTEYKFVDQLQHTHDLYQKDKVFATVDLTLSDGTIIPKGTDLAKYTETVYNKETGHYELAFKADFLAQIPRTSEFGADAFVVVKRIKAGDVANEYTLYVNGNPVKSNKVTTHTPEPSQPVTPKAPALPSTGEQGVSVLTVLGAALLSLLGVVGLKKRQQ